MATYKAVMRPVQLYTIAKKKRHEVHIFKGRVKGKERRECDGGHLDLNCLISRCWIRGRSTAYFLIQYLWFKQEYKLQIPVLKYSPQLLDICVECIIYVGNKIYNYCTKNIDNIVISKREKYVKIGV